MLVMYIVLSDTVKVGYINNLTLATDEILLIKTWILL